MTFAIRIHHVPGCAAVTELYAVDDGRPNKLGAVTSQEPATGIRTMSDHAKRLADA